MQFKIQHFKCPLEYKAVIALLNFEQISYIELGEQIDTLKYLKGHPGVCILDYNTNELLAEGIYKLIDNIILKGFRQI